jgi:hypothetical protein
MSFTTDTAARQAFITGLRHLADYLDRHPVLPVPVYGTEIYLTADRIENGGCSQVNEFARQLGIAATAISSESAHYEAVMSFGPVGYRMTAISEHAMALYYAADSYYGCVTPDTWT